MLPKTKRLSLYLVNDLFILHYVSVNLYTKLCSQTHTYKAQLMLLTKFFKTQGPSCITYKTDPIQVRSCYSQSSHKLTVSMNPSFYNSTFFTVQILLSDISIAINY